MRTPKYGLKLRRTYLSVRKRQKARYLCPKCGRKKLVRVSTALWKCRACGVLMAGGAYSPRSS